MEINNQAVADAKSEYKKPGGNKFPPGNFYTRFFVSSLLTR